MNGAESLLHTAVAAGIDACFANPGTTEMPLVAALDSVAGVRGVLGLFEGVCTGAADGYGRMLAKPALTLLHLGPGLSNGLANLHNAWRAGSPVVNLVGEHATWHRAADAPLTSDIESLAKPVSPWVHRATSSQTLARDGAAAIAAAVGPPSGVATLIVPQDCQWAEGVVAARVVPRGLKPVPEQTVAEARASLQKRGRALLFLGGRALSRRGLRAAARVARHSGAGLMSEGFPARVTMGAGVPLAPRIPYFPEQAREATADFSEVVLAGCAAPVAFFGYRHQSSDILPDAARVVELAGKADDVEGALEALAEALGAADQLDVETRTRPLAPTGKLNVDTLGRAVVAAQPQGAIIVEEAATSGLGYYMYNTAAPPHTVLTLTGGSIGYGLPCAVGAAVACPERKVIALQSDGAGMYTLQALWTMAREQLDVTVVVCANQVYRILKAELRRGGVIEPGETARSLTDLRRPELDWTHLARGLGVPAVRVRSAEALCRELARALAEPGPSLIEAQVVK